MHARPRAKVNLTLSVGPRGRDGYHLLESVFLRVGLADELTVSLGNGTGSDVLTVSGLPGCEVDGNLVLRGFRAARAALGIDMPPLVAHLDKRIPMAAGLGGGSSDAAAAVDCALAMWGAGLAPARVLAVATDLGADVPFYASGAAAASVTGRGELVEPLAVSGDPALLLVTPPISLSTPAVFARFDDLGAPSHEGAVTPELDALADTYQQLRDANDLWPAAASLAPALGELRDELESQTSRAWLMSGSGSTLFAIYASPDAAATAGRALVASESVILGGASFAAVSLSGTDPLWRYS